MYINLKTFKNVKLQNNFQNLQINIFINTKVQYEGQHIYICVHECMYIHTLHVHIMMCTSLYA